MSLNLVLKNDNGLVIRFDFDSVLPRVDELFFFRSEKISKELCLFTRGTIGANQRSLHLIISCRSAPPFHGFVILSTVSRETFVQIIKPSMEFKHTPSHDAFLQYKVDVGGSNERKHR